MASILKVSFPTLDTAQMVVSLNGIDFAPAITPVDIVTQFPNQFWIEPDASGVNQLCTSTIEGFAFPEAKGESGFIHKSREFFTYATYDTGKTAGDNRWHPVSKPQRP